MLGGFVLIFAVYWIGVYLGRWSKMTAIEQAKAEAIKEFAERVHTEIEAAITSNRKAITVRVSRGVNPQEDGLCKYCYGKVHALDGIDDYIADLVKEFTGEQT